LTGVSRDLVRVFREVWRAYLEKPSGEHHKGFKATAGRKA
jgi:hypothetical protein